MGLFLSKKGRSPNSAPVAPDTPAPETVCSKSDHEMWRYTIHMVEGAISKATDERLRENMQAVLGWLKEYGYPNQKCQLWAFDGVVRCQKIDDAYQVYATLHDFTDRRDECYAIVSSHFIS